jgi:Tfp pilus assembly protein PilP
MSVRTDAQMKKAYKDALGDKNMSDDLREYMQKVVAQNGGEIDHDGHLPNDKELAEAYLRLNDLADPDSRQIPVDVAESDLANQLNRPKKTVRQAVIEPLERRGFVSPRWGTIRVTRPEVLQE